MINLFHDTLTGVRSALVDYEEVPGSLGTSALLMESEGHKIKFAIKSSGEQGYILVKRTGWIGFEYKCFIEGKQVLEVTETVAKNQDEQQYSVDIIEYMSTPVSNGSHIRFEMLCCKIVYVLLSCLLMVSTGRVVRAVYRLVRD